MAEYPYHPMLKKPGPLGSIDFANPALAPAVRMTVQNLRQAARAWRPPVGIAVRIESAASQNGTVECFVVEPKTDAPLPGMLFCHGGGFFLPVQASALHLAALYAQKVRIRVFLPEYSLLPESPFPIPLRDCLSIWERMRGESEAHPLDGRLLLYGESAGGALAAGIARLLRDRGETPPRGQLLIYPALDDRSERYPSARQYGSAVWSGRANASMWRAYLKNGTGGEDAYAVPLRACEFTALPPAYIEPQEIDLLRDEGAAYAQALRAAGVPTELHIVQGSYHGFDTDTENPFVRRILERRIHIMERMLAENEVEERML